MSGRTGDKRRPGDGHCCAEALFDGSLIKAGDLIQAMAEDPDLSAESLHTLRDLVRGQVQRATDRPNVFKGTGMSWQDLAIAVGVHETR